MLCSSCRGVPLWRPQSRRLAPAGLISVLVLGLAASVWSQPAAAHTDFDSSEPEDRSAVTAPIDEVVLHFTSSVIKVGEGFAVLEPDGEVRYPDTLVNSDEGATWTLGFDPPLAVGEVGVRWTVQAEDAHPIQGAIRFTVEAATDVEAAGVDPLAGGSETAASQADDASDGAASNETIGADEPTAGRLDSFLVEDRLGPTGVNATSGFARVLSLLGSLVAIGGTIFVMTVVGHRRADAAGVMQLVQVAGLMALIGAIAELFTQVALNFANWSAAISPAGLDTPVARSFAVAVGLRAVSGLVVALTAPYRAFKIPLMVGLAGLVVAFLFDGHTATRGDWWLIVPADLLHVVAASTWAGGVMAFALVALLRRRRRRPVEALELAVRFSVVASAAVVAAGVGGAAMTLSILDSVDPLFNSTWGWALLGKVGLVLMAGVLGAVNHFRIIPAMLDGGGEGAVASGRLVRVVSLEAVILVGVIVLTAVLVAQGTAPVDAG